MRRAASSLGVACGAVALWAGAARAEGPAGYAIEAPARVEAEVGAMAEISFSIAPEAGFAIAREGAFWIELAPSPEAALELPRARYGRRDAADARAVAPRFDLQVRPREPGSFELAVTASFWLCRRRSCVPVSDTRTIDIAARGPADASSP
jgi:hypothetical protein